MKKTISSGLIGGLIVIIFILVFTNLFGVDPATFYRNLVEDTLFNKYYLDLVLVILISLAIIFAYKKSIYK